MIISDEEQLQQEQNNSNDRLNTIETIRLSLTFCILWFCANYSTNASLAYTSVGSSTILSSTSGNFFLFSLPHFFHHFFSSFFFQLERCFVLFIKIPIIIV